MGLNSHVKKSFPSSAYSRVEKEKYTLTSSTSSKSINQSNVLDAQLREIEVLSICDSTELGEHVKYKK